MNNRKIPKRVEINGKWFEVREGLAGRLELHEFMKNPEFTADQPYTHMKNFYHVYHSSGRKIGDLHLDNEMCSGAVSGFEV